MKIGVLLRETGDRFTLNKEIKEVIEAYNGIVIGLSPISFEQFIEASDMCDGFILQGGTDTSLLEIQIV